MDTVTPIEKMINSIKFLPRLFSYQLILAHKKKKFFKKEPNKSMDEWDNKEDCLIDKFVLVGVFIAFISVFIADFLLNMNLGLIREIILWIFIIWGILRIGDIVTYQLYALLVTRGADLHSPQRMIALLLINYLEILFWFALFYRCFNSWFSEGIKSISGSFYFSTVTMTTLGFGNIRPIQWPGMFFVSLQTLIGIFVALVLLARFIPALGEFENKRKDP